MRQPDPGVSQSPALRHDLDYALLVGYNCMSLLWRKRTPIPARRPGVVRYAGPFLSRLSSLSLSVSGTLFANSLPYKPYQEYRITVRGRPPMGTRILLMLLCLGILSTVSGCSVAPPSVTPPPAAPSTVAPPSTPAPSDGPPSVAPPPYIHPPYTTGNRRSDTYQPSPYEQKMDEEEQQYRQQRSTQERAQERAYQQWQQERERERDPHYEWMR
jgi:hypothetical protein